ncbi:restriction endonuclease subunit S [Vibrio cholerae]
MSDMKCYPLQRLGELVSGNRGVSYKPENLKTAIDDNSVVLLRSNNIQSGTLNFDNVQIVPDSLVSDSQILKKGDIAVCMSNGSRQLVGKSGMLQHEIEHPLTVGAFCSVFRCQNEDDSEYVRYLFQSQAYQHGIDVALAGSAINNLKNSDIEAIEVPTAPKELRKKIAEILSTIDNQIEATQALIDKYTAIKQGMMADLFSRGIDPETKALRPTFEEAPELYHKTPLGILPKEWNVKTLGDISEKITSGSRDWAKFYSSEGDLFVRISNLTREHVNFRWNSVKYVNIGGGSEGERTQLQPGDILVSITADLGIVGVVPEDMGRAYINQHTALIRLSTDGENARFIGNYLSSRRGQEQFEKNNDSGAKAGINLPTIASLRCPIPEEKEQILIASKIDALDEVIADLKREKSKSISLKQGLMQDLLTGKVPVPA